MVALGSPLPVFRLPDLRGVTVTSESFAGKPLLVAFVCNHCPYVKHVERGLAETLQRNPDLHVVGICTNDAAAYRDDAPAGRAGGSSGLGIPLPDRRVPGSGPRVRRRLAGRDVLRCNLRHGIVGGTTRFGPPGSQGLQQSAPPSSPPTLIHSMICGM
jgi:AhpC/TSA family protein